MTKRFDVSININEMCKICYEYDKPEKLLSPCNCKGTIKFVHKSCVKDWIKFSGKSVCSECNAEYNFLPKKILDWVDFPVLLFLWLFIFITIIDLELKIYFL